MVVNRDGEAILAVCDVVRLSCDVCGCHVIQTLHSSAGVQSSLDASCSQSLAESLTDTSVDVIVNTDTLQQLSQRYSAESVGEENCGLTQS